MIIINIYIYKFHTFHSEQINTIGKNSTGRQLPIINLFQVATPSEETTSSDSHHITERKKNYKNILSMDSYLF